MATGDGGCRLVGWACSDESSSIGAAQVRGSLDRDGGMPGAKVFSEGTGADTGCRATCREVGPLRLTEVVLSHCTERRPADASG